MSNLPAADTPKVAIITGAGSGIGRAVALKLLANDFRVVLAGRRENALQETLNLADKNTVNGLVVPTDVTDANSVQRLFDCAAAEFGRVDVLFNNAGISAPGELLEDISVEAWQQVVNVNITGPFFCTQAAFRQMKQQSLMGGRIINNGSVSCWAPRPNS